MEMEAQLADARAAYDADPGESTAIWLGRRLAYLGRIDEAIDVYTRALEAAPRSARLLRHRGHRYITIRKFDKAWDDLNLAARIIQEEVLPDELEPDGQPNDRNTPTSSLHTNVFYHLALASYLRGDFAQAAAIWGSVVSQAPMSDDMRVAYTYWWYNALVQLGNLVSARDALTTLQPALDVIENHAYYNLLKHAQGRLSEAQLWEGVEPVSVDEATIVYGLAVQALAAGDTPRMKALLERAMATGQWPTFGATAAEVDLARLRRGDLSPAPASHDRTEEAIRQINRERHN